MHFRDNYVLKDNIHGCLKKYVKAFRRDLSIAIKRNNNNTKLTFSQGG
jgi:hypothetical protein